jgi:hypothetical protein
MESEVVNDQVPGYSRHLIAGLIAGLVAASILIASFLQNLVAAIAYYFLQKITRHARTILAWGVSAFVILSVLPHLGIGPAPSPALAALPVGFDLVTVPLHLVFGLTAVLWIPRFVNRH